MDPFVLSRNIYNAYCSKYVNISSSSTVDIHCSKQRTNEISNEYDNAVEKLNQRYQYFLHALNRLQETTKTFHLYSLNKNDNNYLSIQSKRKKTTRRMPKVYVTVSCSKHLKR